MRGTAKLSDGIVNGERAAAAFPGLCETELDSLTWNTIRPGVCEASLCREQADVGSRISHQGELFATLG